MASDQLLDEDDMNYLLAVMPERHPEDRPEGSSIKAIFDSKHKMDEVEAYYLKHNTWIPCADFEKIEEIFERILDVACCRMVYKTEGKYWIKMN